MNHTTKKYVQERITSISRQHELAVEQDGKAKRRPELSTEQKLRMIRDGSARLEMERVVGHGKWCTPPDLLDVFYFPGENEIDHHNLGVAEEIASRQARIRAAANDLRDELLLGDAVDVLTKLRAFQDEAF